MVGRKFEKYVLCYKIKQMYDIFSYLFVNLLYMLVSWDL